MRQSVLRPCIIEMLCVMLSWTYLLVHGAILKWTLCNTHVVIRVDSFIVLFCADVAVDLPSHSWSSTLMDAVHTRGDLC